MRYLKITNWWIYNLATSISKDINKINDANISDDKEQLEELLVKKIEMLEILKENSNEIEKPVKTNLKKLMELVALTALL